MILNKIFNKIKKVDDKKGIIPKEYIYSFLPSNPVVIEAGAHIGIDTMQLAKISSFVHAFEPVPNIYQDLVKNTIKFKNVKCWDYALSNNDGTANMYISSGVSDASSSLLKPREHLAIHPEVVFEEQLKVNTITLDTWALKYSINKADLLWLDLQGNELNVIKAGMSLIKNVTAIYTEVNLLENYEKTSLYKDLKDYLINNGFLVSREELPWKDAGNVLFVKHTNLKK